MAEVTSSKVANWRGTWIHYAYLRMHGMIQAQEKLAEKISRIKEVIRQAAVSAGLEYIFFDEGDGLHIYTQNPSFKDVVDEARLKEANPELYEKCCKKVFDEKAFMALASEEDKKKFVESKQTRAGAERFDSAKSVKVVLKEGTKAKTYKGGGTEYMKGFPPLDTIPRTEKGEVLDEIAKDIEGANGSPLVLDDLSALRFVTKESDMQIGLGHGN